MILPSGDIYLDMALPVPTTEPNAYPPPQSFALQLPGIEAFNEALMGIDPVREMREQGGRYCHVQIADAPGRSQPGTGRIDFPALYRAIRDSGYEGLIGSEYHPAADTLGSLGWMREAGEILGGDVGAG